MQRRLLYCNRILGIRPFNGMAESVSENGSEAHPPGRYGRTTTEHLPALLRPFRLCPVKTPLKSELSKFEWQWCFDFSEKQLKIGSAPFSLRLKNIFCKAGTVLVDFSCKIC